MHRGPVLVGIDPSCLDNFEMCPKGGVEDDHHGEGNHDQRYRVTKPGLGKPDLFCQQEVDCEGGQDKEEDRHIFLECHPPSDGKACEQGIPELASLSVGDERSQYQHREEELEYVVAEEPRKIYQAGREGNKEAGDQGLALVKVSHPVDPVDERNDRDAKEGRKDPGDEIAVTKEREHSRSDIIQERSVIHRFIRINALCHQAVREPRMDRLIVMEEFEIEG